MRRSLQQADHSHCTLHSHLLAALILLLLLLLLFLSLTTVVSIRVGCELLYCIFLFKRVKWGYSRFNNKVYMRKKGTHILSLLYFVR